MSVSPPILYSYRRCPYAMRARMALFQTGIAFEIREIAFSNKPAHMLSASPKGTVPVLVLASGKVLDESLDIMQWALHQKDPDGWLNIGEDGYELINRNDGPFKYYLDRYKYADRYPEFSQTHYRQQAELFIDELEIRLKDSTYLCGEGLSIADIAVFPFIRQFSRVDESWFHASRYSAVKNWLERRVSSNLFRSIMQKHSVWQPENNQKTV